MICVWLPGNSLYKGPSLCWVLSFLFVKVFFSSVYTVYSFLDPFLSCSDCATSGTSVKHTHTHTCTQINSEFNPQKNVCLVLYCCNTFLNTNFQLYCLMEVWHCPHPRHVLSWLNEFFHHGCLIAYIQWHFSVLCYTFETLKSPSDPRCTVHTTVRSG